MNLTGTMLGMKSVTPSMRRPAGGSIINISSNSGIWGIPMAAAYCSSKWAVRGLSKTAALELGKHGIRVNSVHPGGMDTPMTRMPGYDPNEAAWAKALPLGRMGQPDEIAAVVAFLASDEAATSPARSGRSTAVPQPAIAASSPENRCGILRTYRDRRRRARPVRHLSRLHMVR